MRTIEIKLVELNEEVLNIGHVGEKDHTQVVIHCACLFGQNPNAVGTMVAKPPKGDMYPVNMTRSGTDLIWAVSDSDLACAGGGSFQLTFTDGTEIIKTAYGAYMVYPSMVATGDPPDPIEDWMTAAGVLYEAFAGMTAAAEVLPAGSAATASLTVEDGHKVLTVGFPVGAEITDDDEGNVTITFPAVANATGVSF